jgi:cytochrome c peroxidase
MRKEVIGEVNQAEEKWNKNFFREDNMERHRKGIFAYITIMLFMLQALGAPPLVGIANAQTTLDPGAVRAFAALKGLKSLRVAIQEDAAADLGLPLLLGPPGRNVPLPKNLKSVLNNKNKDARKVAAQLGKALFWDMALGSDGNACASCHFHAGGDNRIKNQLSPDITRVKNIRQGDIRGFHFADNDEDLLFQHPDGLTWGPNYTLDFDDFPFVQDIGDGDNVLPSPEAETINPANKNTNDVASSQGVFFTQFVSVGPSSFNPFALGSAPVQIRDDGIPVEDGLEFKVTADDGTFGGKVNVRRVEPRNTPTNINAVFNFHNFWDGRANHWFNGVNPFGRTDKNASVFTKGKGNSIRTKKIQLNNSSLASQAVGPPLSVMEMSFAAPGAPERMWPDVGKKMVGRYLLESQTVLTSDSLLGKLRSDEGPAPISAGKGINVTYGELIKEAFDKSLWDSDAQITLSQMSLTMLSSNSPLQKLGKAQVEGGEPSYSLMEANFSLFFGVAVMLYQAELVADYTPFDQFMEGDDNALSEEAIRGLAVFVGFDDGSGVTDGRCVNCHGGPELTNASVRNAQGGNNIIEPMIMGDFQPAFYDNGFYNISVTPTAEDRGRGELGPEEKPLSSSRQFLFDNQGIQNINFPIIGAPIQGLIPVGPVFIDGVCQEPILQTPVGSIEVCRDLNCDGACGVNDELLLLRVAVDGAFKTPGIRNQALMGPYMHNGGLKTLLEVVEFYDRGGNFCRLNFVDLDPDIQFIGLSAAEEKGLVQLMIEMTDERVVKREAPFDHPELRIPNGHPGTHTETTADAFFFNEQAVDVVRDIAAVGATGGADIEDFHVELGLDPGLDGHMEAGAVDSDVNVDGAPKCNRPNPAP